MIDRSTIYRSTNSTPNDRNFVIDFKRDTRHVDSVHERFRMGCDTEGNRHSRAYVGDGAEDRFEVQIRTEGKHQDGEGVSRPLEVKGIGTRGKAGDET